jgi:hypothetical protein
LDHRRHEREPETETVEFDDEPEPTLDKAGIQQRIRIIREEKQRIGRNLRAEELDRLL